jgi:hypothetical protein
MVSETRQVCKEAYGSPPESFLLTLRHHLLTIRLRHGTKRLQTHRRIHHDRNILPTMPCTPPRTVCVLRHHVTDSSLAGVR